uniref:Uncharacterized protein n=1 Tax=Tetranychus urticae TaxID=32264 RepID=T1JX47_TETUR
MFHETRHIFNIHYKYNIDVKDFKQSKYPELLEQINFSIKTRNFIG